MDQKPLLERRFELKLSERDYETLEEMAALDGVSKGYILRGALQAMARWERYKSRLARTEWRRRSGK